MKNISIAIIIIILSLGAFFILSNQNGKVKSATDTNQISANVTQEHGIQIIKVQANSNGYTPTKIFAKANTPTKLIVTSKNSYGCERSFKIPKLNITQILPVEGDTEINLGSTKAGESIFGSCSMGMYTLSIKFID